MSYNVNVYRPLATAPSWTRLSHTLLFPAESTKKKRKSKRGRWLPWELENGLDIQVQGRLSQIYSFCFYWSVMLHRSFMRTFCNAPIRPHIFTVASLFHQHLRKTYHFKKLSTRALTGELKAHGNNEGHSTTTQKYSSRELQKDHRRFFNQPLRNRSVTMKTAPTTMDTNIAANVQDLFSGEIYLNRLSECNFGFDLYK